MLVVFGGLPGTGKTTLARPVAEKLSAAYRGVDAIAERSHAECPGGPR